jgi:hypothetical protein
VRAYVYFDADQPALTKISGFVEELIAQYGVRLLVRADGVQLARLAEQGRRVELYEPPKYCTAHQERCPITLQPPADAPPGWWHPPARAEQRYYAVIFVGPPLPKWVDDVKDKGATLIGPGSGFIVVSMNQEQARKVLALGRVESVGELFPYLKVYPDVFKFARLHPKDEQEINVVLWDAGCRKNIERLITKWGGRIKKSGRNNIICKLRANGIRLLAMRNEVSVIEPWSPPSLSNR